MDKLGKIVGDNLAELRKRQRLTQQELAEKTGISDKSLSKWELGKAIPRVELLKQLADFYGVTTDFLLTENSAKTHKDETKDEKTEVNKIVIVSLLAAFVFLCAAVVVANGFFSQTGTETDFRILVAFLWALPVAAFVSFLAVLKFWGRNVPFYALVSVFIWSLMVSFIVHFYLYDNQFMWFILILGIPLQIMVILIANLR